MNDFIEGLGGRDARLLEVHIVDPIPGTVTVECTAHGTTWVECEVNLTSIASPRQIVLRLDQAALQRLAEEAANAAPANSTIKSGTTAASPPPRATGER